MQPQKSSPFKHASLQTYVHNHIRNAMFGKIQHINQTNKKAVHVLKNSISTYLLTCYCLLAAFIVLLAVHAKCNRSNASINMPILKDLRCDTILNQIRFLVASILPSTYKTLHTNWWHITMPNSDIIVLSFTIQQWNHMFPPLHMWVSPEIFRMSHMEEYQCDWNWNTIQTDHDIKKSDYKKQCNYYT